MKPPYEVLSARVVDIKGTLRQLWANSFEMLRGELADRKLEHFYLGNPAGTGLVTLLRDSRAQVDIGVQTLVQRRFFWGEQTLSAGIMADYAVDPAHRSLGPALQLLKASIAGSKSKLAFVYGFPNRKAEPILRRAGLEPILQLGRYAAPLRSQRYLVSRISSILVPFAAAVVDVVLAGIDWWRARLLGSSLSWRAGEAEKAALDTIWSSSGRSELLVSERSAEMIRWRYELQAVEDSRNRDFAGWRLDLLVAKKKQACGYVVWALRDGVAVIGDFFSHNPAALTGPMLAAFRCRARRHGAEAVSLEFTGCPGVAAGLLRAGFALRESHPVFAIQHQNLPSPANWYLTGYDRDTD